MIKNPNIILISCHDIGQHLGCYGIETIHTPALDQFAAEGCRFESSFCAAPQCSPSRASIYTGRYPHNNGVMGLIHDNFAWDLNPGEQHLADILQSAGYRTGLIGIQHETLHPEKHGFADLKQKWEPCEKVAQTSVKYLNEISKTSQPFYLQVGFWEPHRKFDWGGATPDDSKGVTVPPYLVDSPSARREFAEFQGIIRKVDRAIGTILKAIDDNGLVENTITIFTADHGIPFPKAKCSLYDPGIEVAFIIRWPDRGWGGNRTFSELISNVDYLPTLLEAAGIPIPENVQGNSLVSLLDGKEYRPREEIFAEMTYHDYYDPRRCIRTSDYKLIVNFSTAPFFQNPSQTWRPATITVKPEDPTYAYHPHIELYDLNKDPLEFNNVENQPEYEEHKQRLTEKLYNWMNTTHDPLLFGIPVSPHHKRAIEILSSAGKRSMS
jgi:arylsulfatase A-like enzyme